MIDRGYIPPARVAGVAGGEVSAEPFPTILFFIVENTWDSVIISVAFVFAKSSPNVVSKSSSTVVVKTFAMPAIGQKVSVVTLLKSRLPLGCPRRDGVLKFRAEDVVER